MRKSESNQGEKPRAARVAQPRACVSLILACGVLLAACGNGEPAARGNGGDSAPQVPVIGTDMAMPVDSPFCSFSAETDETGDTFIFVNEIGENAYHGYAKLNGVVEKLTEVEASFGAGMETRRFVDDDESVELEVILIETQVTDTLAEYTGSIRVIHPLEGDAIRLKGTCRLSEAGG